MNKKELVAAVAAGADLSVGDAGAAVDAVIETVTKTLQNGDDVRLPGFGTFKVTRRAAREGRNPATGQPMKFPATNVPKFSAGKGLKEAVN